MLGRGERFTDVPFFWTRHYGLSIAYTGHAESWDTIDVDGSIEKRDCALTFRRGGKILAVVTMGRGKAGLEAAVALATQR